MKQEEMITVINNYLTIVDSKLKKLDDEIMYVEEGVARELEKIISDKLTEITDDIRYEEIQKKLLAFKKAHQRSLVEKKLEGLQSARKQTLELKDQIHFLLKSFIESF